jgi:hypothetical protein
MPQSSPPSAPTTSSTPAAVTTSSAVSASATCVAGSTYYKYQSLKVCTCGLDSSGKLVFYDPAGLCMEQIYCGTDNSTSVCAADETCMPDICESGVAHCAPLIPGCQGFPQVTEMVMGSVPTAS